MKKALFASVSLFRNATMLAVMASIMLFSFAASDLVFGNSIAEAYTSPGKPSGYVNDFAQILTPEQAGSLNARLIEFKATSTNEIAIVTIMTLGGETVESYAENLFQEWGIGKADKDNGVLLLIAMDERKLRIETGYGLEGALPDSIASSIIRNDLTPAFKAGTYAEGINLAVDHIMAATRNEYAADVVPRSGSGSSASGNFMDTLFFWLVPILLILQWAFAAMARSKSWYAGGIAGGIIGGLATAFGVAGLTLSIGLIVTAVLALFGSLFDYIISKNYKKIKSSGIPKSQYPWWMGGGTSGGGSSFGRSSSSGFGGGGGFSGGSSGGGGASGGW